MMGGRWWVFGCIDVPRELPYWEWENYNLWRSHSDVLTVPQARPPAYNLAQSALKAWWCPIEKRIFWHGLYELKHFLTSSILQTPRRMTQKTGTRSVWSKTFLGRTVAAIVVDNLIYTVLVGRTGIVGKVRYFRHQRSVSQSPCIPILEIFLKC